jgi:hypothetical protein
LGQTPPINLVGLILDLAKEEEYRKRTVSIAALLRRIPKRQVPVSSENIPGEAEGIRGTEGLPTKPDPSELFRIIRDAILARRVGVNRFNAPCYVLDEVTYLAMPRFFKLLAHQGLVAFDPFKMEPHLDALAEHPAVHKGPDGRIVRPIQVTPGGGPFSAIAIESRGLFPESAEIVAKWWTPWRYGPIREITGLDLAIRWRRGDGFDCAQDSERSEILRSILRRMIDHDFVLPKEAPVNWILQAFQGERRELAQEALIRLGKARVIVNVETAASKHAAIVPCFLPEVRAFLDPEVSEECRTASGV